MPVFAALLSAPAHAQTEIWSAELTVGGSSVSFAEGYCLDCSPSLPGGNFGSLSDDDFEFSGTTYIVESVRWGLGSGGETPGMNLHFELDGLPAPEVYATWTLQIGDDMFALSGDTLFRGQILRILGAYLGITPPLLGSTVVVRLLEPEEPSGPEEPGEPEEESSELEEPPEESVQGAMGVLDGAVGAQMVADLIAERARPGADLPGASLGSADLIAVSSRAGEAGGWSLERDPDPFGDRADFRGRRVDAARALSGSGFSLRLGEGGGGRFAAWGAGAAAEVEIEVDGYETEYDGDVYAAQIGVEMDVAAGVAVGVAVGTAQGELEVRNSGLRRIERGLLSVHPYMVWTSGAHSGWLAVGFGSGDYEVERADGARASADASTTM